MCDLFVQQKRKKREIGGDRKNIPKRIIARYGLDILLARSLSRLCIHVEHVPSKKKSKRLFKVAKEKEENKCKVTEK